MATGQAVAARGFTGGGIGLAVVEGSEHRQPLVGAMAGLAHIAGRWVISGFTRGHTAMATRADFLGLSVVYRL